jgi:hypothetical protein
MELNLRKYLLATSRYGVQGYSSILNIETSFKAKKCRYFHIEFPPIFERAFFCNVPKLCPKRDEVTREWTRLRNEELYVL